MVQLSTLVLRAAAVVSLPSHARHPVAFACGWYVPAAQSVHAVSFDAGAKVPGAQASHAAGGATRVPGGHGHRAYSRGSVGVLSATTVTVCSVAGCVSRQTPAVEFSRAASSRARSSSVNEMPPSAL